jgi:hypothetical protein
MYNWKGSGIGACFGPPEKLLLMQFSANLLPPPSGYVLKEVALLYFYASYLRYPVRAYEQFLANKDIEEVEIEVGDETLTVIMPTLATWTAMRADIDSGGIEWDEVCEGRKKFLQFNR